MKFFIRAERIMERDVREISTDNVCSRHVGNFEISTCQVGISKVGVDESSPVEVCTREVRSREISTLKVREFKISAREVDPAEGGAGEVASVPINPRTGRRTAF